MKVLMTILLFVVASPVWSQNEIERDLDGNSSVFQTVPTYPEAAKKTGGSNERR